MFIHFFISIYDHKLVAYFNIYKYKCIILNTFKIKMHIIQHLKIVYTSFLYAQNLVQYRCLQMFRQFDFEIYGQKNIYFEKTHILFVQHKSRWFFILCLLLLWDIWTICMAPRNTTMRLFMFVQCCVIYNEHIHSTDTLMIFDAIQKIM